MAARIVSWCVVLVSAIGGALKFVGCHREGVVVNFAEYSDEKYLKPLNPSVSLTDLSYPYMLIPRSDLKPDELEQLASGSRGGLQVCEIIEPEEEFVFIRLGSRYPEGDDELAGKAAALIAKHYVKTAVLRDTSSRWL